MNAAVMYEDRKYFYYDLDWVDAFLAQKEIPISVHEFFSLNLSGIRKLLNSDFIFILHSCDLSYPGVKQVVLKNALRFRKGRLIYFPRNEFKNFRRKRAFIKLAKVDLVASQLPLESAEYLYGDLAKVISLPHALNPKVFQPSVTFEKRRITIGGRSDVYPSFLLDESRNAIDHFLRKVGKLRPGIIVDYSTRLQDRFDRKGWSAFLGQCQFTISSEAGGIYVDKTDRLQHSIERYLKGHPVVPVEEVREQFREQLRVLPSGKCISSRHFEAIGTQTCQILAEGHYSGIIQPNVHYIELKKDHSNIEEVLRSMENRRRVREITEAVFRLVVSEHTYSHRVEELFRVLQAL
jgi:hypothetical protein